MEHTFYESLALWSEVAGGIAFFIAAYLLFRRYIAPAVTAIATARNAELVAAEERREQLRLQVEEARAALLTAETEAASIAVRAQSDAQREADRILAEAHAERLRVIRNAEGELERSRIAARDRLRVEFIERALVRARALAAERLTTEINARLVARTVDELTKRGS